MRAKAFHTDKPADYENNTKIEASASLALRDTVIITGSGLVGGNGAGLALFMSPADLVSSGSVLPGSAVSFDGYVSKVVKGGSVTQAVNGQLTYSKPDQGGDSGGAFLLNVGGRDYVLGTLFGKNAASTVSYGTYFQTSEWQSVNATLATNQTGNVSSSEPVNLIVGTDAADTGSYGTFRSDIMLGRGGNDVLDGGDRIGTAPRAWGNDQLFGGTGNDVLMAGHGSDLMHGGNRVAAAQSTAQLVADGSDTADYNASGNIRISIGGTAASAAFATGANANVDVGRAVYVASLSTPADIDTLVSIERIVATTGQNTVIVSSFDASRLANADHLGGLDRIELSTDGLGIDTIDLSGANEAAKVMLSGATPYVAALAQDTRRIQIAGADKVIGSAHADRFEVDGTKVNLMGNGGNDSFFLKGDNIAADGGDGDDLIQDDGRSNTLRGGGGDDYIQILSANPSAIIYGGAGDDVIDTASAAKTTSSSATIVKFGPSDGHDSIVARNSDYYGTDWRNHWNIDRIELGVTSAADVTVIWNPTVYHSIEIPDAGSYMYYGQGDLVFLIESTGDSVLLENAEGSWGGRQPSTDYTAADFFSLSIPGVGIPGHIGSLASAPGITFMKAAVDTYDVARGHYEGPPPADPIYPPWTPPVGPLPPLLPLGSFIDDEGGGYDAGIPAWKFFGDYAADYFTMI